MVFGCLAGVVQGAAFVLLDMARGRASDISDVVDNGAEDQEGGSTVAVSSCSEDNGIEVVDAATTCSVATDTNGAMLCNQLALQRYLLHCAQYAEGGLRGETSSSSSYPPHPNPHLID